MKKLIVFTAFALSSLAVTAQTASEIPTVRITAEQDSSGLNKAYVMLAEQFAKFKGAYKMRNGMSMSLFEIDRARFAQINDEEKHEIVATAANSFVAQDKKMKIRIDLDDNGQANGEVYYILPAFYSGEGLVTPAGWMRTALKR